MRRWLPYPAMSGFILIAWLLLNQTLSPAHILLGAVLGVVLSVLLRRLDLPPVRIRKPGLLLVLAGRVAMDILRSNIAVMAIILSGRNRQITSGFVRIPLLLNNGYGLAILACIITSTPGTLWISYQPQQGVLMIHVFDLVDETAWIETIVNRYERPLREIFQ